MRPTCARTRKGFNLVEAAIVLGVIGLVIGGIWIAASDVSAAQRLNKVVSDTAFIINNARNVFPLQNYPASGFTNVNTAAFHAGVFPRDFVLSGVLTSPEGVVYTLQTSCNSGGLCPALMLQIFTRNQTGAAFRNSLTTRECITVAQRLSVDKDVLRFYVTRVGGMSSVTYNVPVDPVTINCTVNDGYLDFRFRR